MPLGKPFKHFEESKPRKSPHLIITANDTHSNLHAQINKYERTLENHLEYRTAGGRRTIRARYSTLDGEHFNGPSDDERQQMGSQRPRRAHARTVVCDPRNASECFKADGFRTTPLPRLIPPPSPPRAPFTPFVAR